MDPYENAVGQKLRETLEHASLLLHLRKASFPYGREYGSRLHQLDREGEHAEEQAVALANEALLELEGVTASAAELIPGGVKFTIETPFGTREVLYGTL